MIEPITEKNSSVQSDENFPGLTKFIGPDGTGHRGTIIQYLNPKRTAAKVLGLTGEFYHKIILVEEIDPDQWPVFVRWATT